MLTTAKLQRATEIQKEIDALRAEQTELLNSDGALGVLTIHKAGRKPAKAKGQRKPMSAESKAKIAAAQKLRWAKTAAKEEAPAPVKAVKVKKEKKSKVPPPVAESAPAPKPVAAE